MVGGSDNVNNNGLPDLPVEDSAAGLREEFSKPGGQVTPESFQAQDAAGAEKAADGIGMLRDEALSFSAVSTDSGRARGARGAEPEFLDFGGTGDTEGTVGEEEQPPSSDDISPVARNVRGFDTGNSNDIDFEEKPTVNKNDDGSQTFTSTGELETGAFDTTFNKQVTVGADGKVKEASVEYGSGVDMTFGEGGQRGVAMVKGVTRATMVPTADGGTLLVVEPKQGSLLTGAAGEFNAVRFDKNGNYIGTGNVDSENRSTWVQQGARR